MPRDLSPEATKLIDAALRASKRHGADAHSPSKAETYLLRRRNFVTTWLSSKRALPASKHGLDDPPYSHGATMRHKESPRAAKLLADALAAAKYDHIDQVAAQRAIEALREYIAQLEVNLFPHGLNDPQPVTCRGCELGWPLDGLAKARRIAAPSAKRSQAL